MPATYSVPSKSKLFLGRPLLLRIVVLPKEALLATYNIQKRLDGAELSGDGRTLYYSPLTSNYFV